MDKELLSTFLDYDYCRDCELKDSCSKIPVFHCEYNKAKHALKSFMDDYEKLEKALDKVINDCDEIGIDWFEQIAEVEDREKELSDLTDRYGWIDGIKHYYLESEKE